MRSKVGKACLVWSENRGYRALKGPHLRPVKVKVVKEIKNDYRYMQDNVSVKYLLEHVK